MRTFFLTILCVGLVVGGEGAALDVAAKHLEDYQRQRKAIGDEDALQVLRLQCLYHFSKKAAQTDPLDIDAWGSNMSIILAMHKRAYHLAEARYKEGLGTLWDVYETGIELYSCTESCTSICRYSSRPVPETFVTLEQLRELRQKLSHSAKETRERWLRAEILWNTCIERDRRKVCAYRSELLELQRNHYQQGLATHWEVALAELDLQEAGLFLPPAEEVLQRWEEYTKAISRLYEQMNQAAPAHLGYDFSKMMCELRLRQLRDERTLSILKAVPFVILQKVAETEGLFLPAGPPPDASKVSD